MAGPEAWVYGVHTVAAAWCNPIRNCRRLLLTATASDSLAECLAQARAQGLPRPDPELCQPGELALVLPDGAVHQGAALLADPLPSVDLDDLLRLADRPDLMIALDQVTDPHNVGAVLRSAAAFRAGAVITTNRHAPAITGVLAKAASGALEAVPLVRVVNLARALTTLGEAGYWLIGLDESGPSLLHQQALDRPTVLVLGAEGRGIRRLTAERCHMLVRLPTGGPIAILNVSNAAAIALYEKAKQRG